MKWQRDENGIYRDWVGRPGIVPVGGGDRVPYTRVSTLAKKLEDQGGLTSWKQKVTALGLVADRSLYGRFAAIAGTVPDPLKDKSIKRDLSALIGEAFKAGGGERAANTGTTIHTLTEAVDSGVEPEFVPDELAPILDAYLWGTTDLGVEAMEGFVVTDEVRAAGSFDRLYRLPDGRVVIGDIKTGADEPKYPNGVTVQCAIYAHGQSYDVRTDTRTPLHPDLDPTTGLLVHLPLAPVDGRQVCDVYTLDLTAGWERAQLAATVRDAASVPKPKKLEIA
ncbi:MAG: hypothetical protein NVSMB4_01610 [Acidimicrobiales bacterium]